MSNNQDVMQVLDFFGIPEISSERNYWLVRAHGGDYFLDFYLNDFIAINWDEIDDMELIESADIEAIKDKIVEVYGEDEGTPGNSARQINKFVNEMKEGDIVLVPSKCSEHIIFGEILSDDIIIYDKSAEDELEESDSEIKKCPYKKRRKIKWLRRIKKTDLDLTLYKLLNSRHTISDANTYASAIDRSLYSFYKKGDRIHTIFEITQTKDIPAIEFINFINTTLDIVHTFNDITDSELNAEDIDLKINVQSPGPAEFISYAAGGALIIGSLSMFLVGGKISFKGINIGKYVDTLSFNFEIPEGGILGEIFKFIKAMRDNNSEIEELKSQLEEMKEKLKIEGPSTDIKDSKNN